MRLLFLSNFYPPHGQGGYEQLCQEVARLLAGRGHDIVMLSGRVAGSGSRDTDGEVDVRRVLELEVEGGMAHTAARLATGGRQRSERRNIAAVEAIIAEIAPDAALVWGLWNVPRSVPAAVERRLPNRTAYYLCDYWPTLPNAYAQRLQAPARRGYAGWLKRSVARLLLPLARAEEPAALSFGAAACVSYAVRDTLAQQGIPVGNAPIIRNGIRLADFARAGKPSAPDGPLRLIYTGRLSPEKGVHVALAALGLLDESIAGRCEMVVAGSGDEAYIRDLRSIAAGGRVPVHFTGLVPREAVARLLADSHVLVFPSEWAEPLARAVIEAMAAGLVVVGTTTGGTGEVLIEGETGLTFHAGDAAGLARQISRLAGDPALRLSLAAAGQQLVLHDFDIEKTADQLEDLLAALAVSSQGQLA